MENNNLAFYKKSPFKAWTALVLGVMFTLLFAFFLESKARSEEFQLFNLRNDRIISRIKEGFIIQSVFIQNTVVFSKSSNVHLNKESYKNFISDTQKQFNSLGIFSIGLNTYVTRDQLSAFQKRMQKENYPDFKVRPEGDREVYTPITFLEPFNDTNKIAIGYDTYSNPIRKTAQDLAIETGKIAITKRITLVQSNGDETQNSILIFAPIFKTGMSTDTVEARKKAIQGFISSPLLINNLIKDVLVNEDISSDQGFSIRLYDADNTSSGQVLYSNIPSSKVQFSKYQQSREIHLGDKNTWLIEFFSNESSKFPNYSFAQETNITIICGLSLSLLAFLYIMSSLKVYQRSERLASYLTKEVNILNQRLELALESANMGVWDYDPINNILIWDDKQFEIFGIHKKSFEGLYSAWVNAIHPEDRERASQESLDAITNKRNFNSEFRITKNGEIRYIKGQAVVVLDSSQNVVRMIGVNYDVTELKETVSSLEQEKKKAEVANLAKSQFLARMSHEIRTPLNGMIGLTSLALRASLSKEIRDYFEQIRFSSNSLLKILNEVLDFAKLESGKMQSETNSFRLLSLLEESKNLFTPSASLKKNTYDFDIDSNIPEYLIGDETHLRQVLVNLIGNAIKFTSEGSITVSAKLNKFFNGHADLVISVEDTGIGISPEDIPKVLRPFEQADEGISRKFGGTGLGLSISQELLALMNSQLQIASIPGKGSSFSFHLQLKIDSTNPSITSINNAPPLISTNREELDLGDVKNKLILVAEDNPINLEVISQMLKILNVNFLSVGNGLECIDMISKHHFDLILMDIQMPILDGFSTTQKIRTMEHLKDIPIIGVSAGISKDNQSLYIQRGMNDTLNKPFTLEELFEVLKKYLK